MTTTGRIPGRLVAHITLLFAILGVTTIQARAQEGDHFTVDHAIDMTRVSSPAMSPDGQHVLFSRTELDWGDNERDSRLWIAGADGSDARPYTSEEGDGAAAWSPDGRWVAFLRSSGEGDARARQIFLLRTDGGEARQLTHHATSVRRFRWLPDAAGLVFLAEDTLPKDVKKARKDGDDAVFVNEAPNGQGRGQWSNLWRVAVDFDSAEAEPITTGERTVGDFAVSPDGGRVAFTYRTENFRNGGNNSEIALVDVAGGEPRDLTDNDAPERSLAWSPDGRTLTFVAPSLETWALDEGNLYAMDLASGETRQLMASWPGNLGDYEWAPDGRSIDFVGLERTISGLYRLDVRNGRVRRLTDRRGVMRSASFSTDHDAVAFTFQTPTSPTEIYTARMRSLDRPVAVTDVGADIRALELADPEVVRWTSADGMEIEGLLYLPPGGRAAPGAFVVEIHGGPAGVYTLGFDSDAQVLAAQGYAILQPNVRGSSGYGDAVLRGNMHDIGGGDFQDVMTGVDAMIQRGVAHPDSLAVKGWSYGGILGGYTITQTDRFRAASIGAMVADWPSEFGVGFNYDVTRWYLGGDPWTNRELWVDRSAYTHADQVETPTILFHGGEDTTDTPGQSMNFFVALQRHGVPTRFIRFPREPHGIGEPRHARTRLVEELRWFQKYVRGDDDWQAPERPGTESGGEPGGEPGAPRG